MSDEPRGRGADAPDHLRIRRVEPRDGPRLRELSEVALRQVDAFAEGVVDEDLHDVETNYLDAGGEFLVGTFDGEVVAMGALSPVGEHTVWADAIVEPDDGPAAEVTRMRVDPDYQQRGIGSRLLEELERRARHLGFAVLVLDTTARQTGAQRLYEGFGYEHEETVEWREYEVLLYRKPLE